MGGGFAFGMGGRPARIWTASDAMAFEDAANGVSEDLGEGSGVQFGRRLAGSGSGRLTRGWMASFMTDETASRTWLAMSSDWAGESWRGGQLAHDVSEALSQGLGEAWRGGSGGGRCVPWMALNRSWETPRMPCMA